MCLPYMPVPDSTFVEIADNEVRRITRKWSAFNKVLTHCPNCGAPYTNDLQCDYCKTERNP